MIVTLLSAVILKEKVGIKRWSAVIVGFIGVLFVVRPGFNEINLATITALGCGICYAFYIISTRKLSNQDSPFLTLIFTGLSGSIVISLISSFLLVLANHFTIDIIDYFSSNWNLSSFSFNTFFKFCRSFKA